MIAMHMVPPSTHFVLVGSERMVKSVKALHLAFGSQAESREEVSTAAQATTKTVLTRTILQI